MMSILNLVGLPAIKTVLVMFTTHQPDARQELSFCQYDFKYSFATMGVNGDREIIE